MEKLRRENNSLKTELAMEFRQFRKPVDAGSADRVAQVRNTQMHVFRAHNCLWIDLASLWHYSVKRVKEPME